MNAESLRPYFEKHRSRPFILRVFRLFFQIGKNNLIGQSTPRLDKELDRALTELSQYVKIEPLSALLRLTIDFCLQEAKRKL
ncbi:MAG: hypothetical protein ACOZBH_00795 [Patescibacteria group bacterium]